MLRTRVIPVVLIDGYSVVKTIQFDSRRNQGNPITVARVYNTRNVDELILLDIDASTQNRSIDLFTIEEIASECFMPLAVGGGLRTLLDIKNVLARGADKVVLNSVAIDNPDFVRQASDVYGAQCIVGSVDFKKTDSGYKVYSRGNITNLDPFDWIKRLVELGCGEIFINSVDLDGMMTGCDLEMITKTVATINVPIIYCGGVKSPEDCIAPIKLGCSAISAASIFHFTRWTPDYIKRIFQENGIPVRL